MAEAKLAPFARPSIPESPIDICCAPETASHAVLSEADMRNLLRMEIELIGGQTAWGNANGVSMSYVHECQKGTRKIGRMVARALGYEPVTVYVPLKKDAEVS